jgi:hypothetical protein
VSGAKPLKKMKTGAAAPPRPKWAREAGHDLSLTAEFLGELRRGVGETAPQRGHGRLARSRCTPVSPPQTAWRGRPADQQAPRA